MALTVWPAARSTLYDWLTGRSPGWPESRPLRLSATCTPPSIGPTACIVSGSAPLATTDSTLTTGGEATMLTATCGVLPGIRSADSSSRGSSASNSTLRRNGNSRTTRALTDRPAAALTPARTSGRSTARAPDQDDSERAAARCSRSTSLLIPLLLQQSPAGGCGTVGPLNRGGTTKAPEPWTDLVCRVGARRQRPRAPARPAASPRCRARAPR